MKVKVLLSITIMFGFSSCATTKDSYWPELQSLNNNKSFCVSELKSQNEIESCKLDLIALDRAKQECGKDSSPEYCLIKAKSDWVQFKMIAGVGGKITNEMAMSYPVMCGYKEKNIKLCTAQSGSKVLRY